MKSLAKTMKHVSLEGFGGPEVLKIKESSLPILKENELLIKIAAASLNRADILQRKGNYPPPIGTTPILGLEASGYIANPNGSWNENQPIMCLLKGGGYSQYAAVHKDHILPIPKNISIEDAAGIPEVWLTAYLNIILSQLKSDENAMIYAGASGVGTSLIQLVKYFKANSVALSSNEKKRDYCLSLGANFSYNYKAISKEDIIMDIKSKGKLIDVIYDCVGAQNSELSLLLMNMDCRWVLYGLLSGGMLSNFNLGSLLSKRASLISTTLRNRNDEFKSDLIKKFKEQILPHFETNEFKVIIDRKIEINWNEENAENMIQEAHKFMEQNESIGKIILVFSDKENNSKPSKL